MNPDKIYVIKDSDDTGVFFNTSSKCGESKLFFGPYNESMAKEIAMVCNVVYKMAIFEKLKEIRSVLGIR